MIAFITIMGVSCFLIGFAAGVFTKMGGEARVTPRTGTGRNDHETGPDQEDD